MPAIDPATARTAQVALTGNPVAGEIWSLALAGQTYTVTVGGAIATLGDIALSLASQVNADDAHVPAYTATAEAGTLIIVNRNGVAVSATLSVTPATPRTVAPGAPVASVALFGLPLAGEVWTVTIGGRAYSVTVGRRDRHARRHRRRPRRCDPRRQHARGFRGPHGARDQRARGLLRGGASGTDLTITSTGGAITAALKNAAGTVMNQATAPPRR